MHGGGPTVPPRAPTDRGLYGAIETPTPRSKAIYTSGETSNNLRNIYQAIDPTHPLDVDSKSTIYTSR